MMKIAIIGGGLAGTSCAYVLKQAGAEPVIYEAGETLAPAASGNPLGLYNPRLSAERTSQSDFYAAGFALAVRTFTAMSPLPLGEGGMPQGIPGEGVDWNPCGALHLMTDEKRAKRFRQTIQNWNWPPEHMRILSASETSETARMELPFESLYLPDSGTVSPKKLCAAYARNVETHLNTKIENLADLKADAVILACGMGVKNFFPALPLQSVRGQITQVKATEATKNLKCNLCYGGYFSPAADGIHTLGATFQRWLDHAEIVEQDDADNIAGLAEISPVLARGLKTTRSRAAVRTT